MQVLQLFGVQWSGGLELVQMVVGTMGARGEIILGVLPVCLVRAPHYVYWAVKGTLSSLSTELYMSTQPLLYMK